MLGFKNYANARRAFAGIGLAAQIRKGQFDIDRLKQQAPGIAEHWLPNDNVDAFLFGLLKLMCQSPKTQ